MVKMTQAHIDRGVRKDGASCPVKLAIEEAYPSAKDIFVESSLILVDGQHVSMPVAVAQWIDAYDDGLTVEPIEFEIEVPA